MLFEISSTLDTASLSRFLGTSKRISSVKRRTKLQHLTPSFGADVPFRNPNMGLWQAARDNNKMLLEFFIHAGASNWNLAMSGASTKDLIEFFIQKGATDFNMGLQAATRRNDKEFVEYFIQKGANNWDAGLISAILSNQKSWIDFYWDKAIRDWNRVMKAAVVMDDIDLVARCITAGANDFNGGLKQTLWNTGSLVVFFIEKGAEDIESALKIAVLRGDVEAVTFLCSHLDAKFEWWGWDAEPFLLEAAKKNNMELVEFFLMEPDRILDVNPALMAAVERGYIEVVQFLVQQGGIELDTALQVALHAGQKEMIEYFEQKRAQWKQELKKHRQHKKVQKARTKRY